MQCAFERVPMSKITDMNTRKFPNENFLVFFWFI